MCQSCWCRDVCQPEWIFIQHLAHDGVNFLSWLVLGHPRSHYLVRLFHSVNGAVISWKWEFWLAAAPAHISLHLSCLQTPLPFCFALMRAHTAASYWPPALLLLHQRTLLPHTSALWDSGWSCYSNCYAMASLLKSVSFLPPRWEESQWYSRGKGRVDLFFFFSF